MPVQWLSNVPASSFGIVLGLAGLGGSWRAARDVLGVPPILGELLYLTAALVWAILCLVYLLKWCQAYKLARTEWEHPVQCCAIGLIGVSTMLIGIGALPYARLVALILFSIGASWAAIFALWRMGDLWRGGREEGTSTPILYLPTVAGSFVATISASALGYQDWAQLTFGAGMLSWLAIESVLLHRLLVGKELPPELRPTMGVQLAPPTVGALAYASITTGPPDTFVHGLIGYGMLQALILLRLLPWILRQPFSLGYWAFTFGTAALATAVLRFAYRAETDVFVTLAPHLFIAANAVIGLIAFASLRKVFISTSRIARAA